MSSPATGTPEIRIRVRQGQKCVPLVPSAPTLSSAKSPWEGVLLERHTHGPLDADKHQHMSHFVCLHLNNVAVTGTASGEGYYGFRPAVTPNGERGLITLDFRGKQISSVASMIPSGVASGK